MIRLIQIIFLTCFSLNLLFSQSIDGDRVRNNILSLERKIKQVSTLAERYQNERAISLVSKAESEFRTALTLLQEWNDLPQLPRNRPKEKLISARAHYNLSNTLIDQAARLLLFKPTANLKTELERLIHQAEAIVHQADKSELRYFLNKARTFHREALNAFSQSLYLKGHEFLKIAIYFAEKTISLAKSNQGDNSRLQRFEEQKNNIQILLNQAARSSDQSNVQAELYKNAQNYFRVVWIVTIHVV